MEGVGKGRVVAGECEAQRDDVVPHRCPQAEDVRAIEDGREELFGLPRREVGRVRLLAAAGRQGGVRFVEDCLGATGRAGLK